MKKTILSVLFLLFAFVQFVQSQCLPPTNISVSNLTSTSVTVSWTDPNTTSGNQYVLTYAAAGSTGGSTLSPVVNPFQIGGLTPCTSYLVTVTTNCGSGSTSSDAVLTFTTSCSNGYGQPLNLTQCIDEQNGNACFNLNSNDSVILGGNNPANHVISYHLSQADASNNVNPLSSPYCNLIGTQTVFSRLADTTNSNVIQINAFQLQASTSISGGVLQPLSQCDSNANGSENFDLTTVSAQLPATSTLTYYSTSTDANTATNPIANPTIFNLLNNQLVTIFVREENSSNCDVVYSLQVNAIANCNLASSCTMANSLCSTIGVAFQNTVNYPSAGSQGCLGSTPNPTWFYLPVSASGNISLLVKQGNIAPNYNNQDVDFICWGPFTNPTCTGLYDYPDGNTALPNNIVDCSYSGAATEQVDIPNAIAGQYYMLQVTNFSNQTGLITIDMLPTSTGVINCPGFNFTAFFDANSNGVKDSGEINFPMGDFHYEKNNDGVVHNITSPTGKYFLFESNSANSYNVSYTVNTAYASYYTVNPLSYSNITSNNNIVDYNFAITSNMPYNDLGVVLIPSSQPRPGFNYFNKIVYGNLSSQVVPTGTISFTRDAATSGIVTSQAGVVYNSTGFTYDFTNLQPFEYRTIDVTLSVPTIPTVNAGQNLTNGVTIAPLTGDVTPLNNTSTVVQEVVNAYDPNDKMEARGPEILHSSFTANDYLYYTIRFENTGTASAINVRINDVLDSQLDESTIQMLSTSHPYVLDRVGTSLTWKFDNIMLPVSVANTMIGKGYVTFKIKPKPGYAVGDIIPNAASIYFDFNPAIVTNTFETEFVSALGSESFHTNEFAVYPNPTTSVLNIQSKLNVTISEVNVYDLLGKQLLNKKMNVSSTEIDMTNYSPGLYLLEVVSENNQKSIHKIIKK